MAIDEAVFRQAQNSPVLPTLRFYGWCRPAVSLGYFQSLSNEIDLAACRREGIDIVCRPTGGKAVYHSDDFTYAVIAADRDALFPPDILGTYEVIGRWLMAGLRELGIRAELAQNERDGSPGPVEDVLLLVSVSLRASCRRQKNSAGAPR